MLDISHLLVVADAYREGTSLPDKTVSGRVFGDQKKLTAMRGGSDITVGRYSAAMQWFSDNWPAGTDWPAGIARPAVSVDAEDTAA
ncbi:MAG TPA: hypothetical protein PKA33_01560 [Amaricoccus sp.]|uniref:hypothetical protein n=1 Tax=Amaricoccus sp. TaxID=1872485 RepID=UPI002C02CAF4|nr:hypothetical protein [Amaricoccus sp.]HMR51218.1 hypothetical protein [Amaricoccus sp.]HMT98033.1 hypothetical protein [Amaricoccus sp.]